MIGFAVLRPEFLVLLLLVPVMVFAWWRWPPPLAVTRSRLVLASRLLLVALLVLALAGVRLTTQPNKRAVVAVVDLSASVKAHGNLDAEASTVKALQGSKGADDLFGVVTFGHDAAVELPLTRDPQFESFQTQPDPSYTDIAGALRLAAGLLPDG
ncbi:MAG TPA: VWA domain-containing protein, partial [Candidatus Dormibacteraeota bacterium]